MLILGLVEIPWWGLIIISFLLYMLWSCRHFNYFRKQGIPGPTPLPLFGNMGKAFTQSLAELEKEYVKKYGERGYYGEFFGALPQLIVYDERMLSDIMVKEFAHFPNRLSFTSGSPISDNMLINLRDSHWKHVRNEMTPTFTTGKLKQMNVEINRCAKTLANSLEEQAKITPDIEVKEFAGGYTMDVIASTAFGIRVDSQKDRNNAFVHYARKAFVLNTTSPVFIVLVFFPEIAMLLIKLGVPVNFFDKDIRDFFEKITRQTLEMRKQNEDKSRADFLQLMIRSQRGENIADEAGNSDSSSADTSSTRGIKTDEILANAMLFFVAGYDTTATSLSFLMYNMARYPDTQQKLVDEINKVIGDKDIIDTTIVQEMPYLDQCINENLRLYPPAIRTNRVVKEDITINGVFMKKGLVIGIPHFGLHMDPRKWPDPERFDPERFSAENKRNRSPFHFLPFGYGPRNCIGMRLALQELKVAAVHMLRKLKFSTCEKTPIPIVFDRNGGLLKAEGGIHLKVEQRN